VKRKVHQWADTGNLDFSPAPPGQFDDPKDYLDEEDLEELPEIDDEEAVDRYLKAYKEFCAACREIQTKMR
jgi:hypothetical protein